jgi:hypothetical protein
VADITVTAQKLDEKLEEIAQSVIRRHLDLSEPSNRTFLLHPDDPEQHQTRWHQWGILTHTRTFLRQFDEDVPQFLQSWGVLSCVDGRLSGTVDGARRWDLLRISILLHDIGKFAVRFRGRIRFHFTEHEKMSGVIIRDELALDKYGLTPAQIAYIARTAEDHFVLALARRRAREQSAYDERFTRSADFDHICRDIRALHPDDYIEVGVLFLGDSLAKADPAVGPADALSQYELNIVVARQYLQTVCGITG